MCGKWQNASPFTATGDQSKAILAVYIAEKDVLAAFIANKTEHVSFKSGCVVLVVKVDWFVVLC